MEKYTLIATTTFGLEALCKRELRDLGMEIKKVQDGRIYFEGTMEDVAKANLWLRTADRVLIELGNFKALSFEELFNKVYEIPWEDIIPANGNFIVNGKSIKSKLFSISDCQRITEKAIIKKLQTKYDIAWFEKSGALYDIEVALLKDYASITLDTTGKGLHKRGYRKKHGDAPIKETLAACMVMLSYWNKDRILYDPFCGSGTILVEAAMIGRNIAPGLERGFAFNNWTGVNKDILAKAKKDALEKIDHHANLKIYGTDIDEEMVNLSREIVADLGFEDDIKIFRKDFRDFDLEDSFGVMITNPPYGERLKISDLARLERDLGEKINKLKTWSSYIITSDENFERNFKRKADRKRKLYNGKIKVDYYQYYGPRPDF
ncbi:THUMP domain-containing class I SAM-dependent RNA methyltransferase [Neofamilia massiliensis]|uniref:THUMP domain-containing class I SAM-dependent RNA methyltransferase n=1 Tax=Neofamilia massiliensis TaxID=1673724 RepID=UPI0006BB8121|nr:class I SAM-dependent RNA methyltransferase [Neofamilia massiliensis]